MLKRLIVLVLVLGSMLLVVRAQDATEEPPPEREIYTVLRWGDDVFEPVVWYASAEELPARTRATWRADSLGGLAFADYLHFEEGITVPQIDNVFDQSWFEASLGGTYDIWRENVRCDLGNLRLIEFSLSSGDTKYSMRYWIDWVSSYRVMAIFLVFPATDLADMELYADKLYPDLPTCMSASG